MDQREAGRCPPPGDRLALRQAHSRAALGDTGVLQGIPFIAALDSLARRWHVPPWVLEDEAHLDWLIRGLEFERMEASVTRG